jgi:O-antigen/teichoic acid export membrane protein
MLAQTAMPVRRLPDLLRRIATDSLARNSFYLMASTVITAAVGYFFWIIAAHSFTKQEIGLGAAVISLCSTISLVTYLGPSAMLIERLPKCEHSSEWTATFRRTCSATGIVTATVMAITVLPAVLISHNYRSFFTGTSEIVLAVACAGTISLLNLIGFAFIAARRAGRFLSMQALVSAAKLVCLFPLAVFGAAGLVEAWVASAAVGIVVAIVWLVPTMGLGRHHHRGSRRSTCGLQRVRGRLRWRVRHRRRSSAPGDNSYMRRLVGQHLTSLGEMLTPLALPVLVVTRLGAEPNAYFYVTWMMGATFFLVSPAVATAVFAEGVRANTGLRNEVAKAMKIIAVLLIPMMLVMIAGGRIILGLFGASYAAAGYTLLLLIAISAIPDAVSNVGTSIWRVSRRLGYAAVLNLGIMVTTLLGAWFLMPPLGITGVGVAWLSAQILGALASLPAYTEVRGVRYAVDGEH